MSVRALALLGVVQLATLAPLAWALARRLPASRAVGVATVVAVAAVVALVALAVLLVTGLSTFAGRIWPVLVTVTGVYGWLLTVSLVGHRTRALPRTITRLGLLLGVGFLAALALAAAGSVLPGIAGRLTHGVGYGLGGVAWLALPAYVLLVAARVLTRPTAGPPVVEPTRQGVPS